MSIEYFQNLLNTNQITPAAIEREISKLEVTLDDAKFFGKSDIEIKNLQSYIDGLKRLLAEDYAKAVARGLEIVTPVTPIISKTEVPLEELPTVTFDGTKLDPEEGREVARLLRLVKAGKMTKFTLLEFIRGLEDQLEKLPKDSPERNDLLMRRVMLQHVVMTGNFKRSEQEKRKQRR